MENNLGIEYIPKSQIRMEVFDDVVQKQLVLIQGKDILYMSLKPAQAFNFRQEYQIFAKDRKFRHIFENK